MPVSARRAAVPLLVAVLLALSGCGGGGGGGSVAPSAVPQAPSNQPAPTGTGRSARSLTGPDACSTPPIQGLVSTTSSLFVDVGETATFQVCTQYDSRYVLSGFDRSVISAPDTVTPNVTSATGIKVGTVAVRGLAPGSTTISIADKKGNIVTVDVTVTGIIVQPWKQPSFASAAIDCSITTTPTNENVLPGFTNCTPSRSSVLGGSSVSLLLWPATVCTAHNDALTGCSSWKVHYANPKVFQFPLHWSTGYYSDFWPQANIWNYGVTIRNGWSSCDTASYFPSGNIIVAVQDDALLGGEDVIFDNEMPSGTGADGECIGEIDDAVGTPVTLVYLTY
jgi:hypothetical protein